MTSFGPVVLRSSSWARRPPVQPGGLPVPRSWFDGHALSGVPRPDVVDGDPVHGTGGRAFAILRVPGCQRGEHRDGNLVVPAMDFRPAPNAYPPEPRPVLVVVVDEYGRRPCGFDVIEPAQLPGALGFVIDRVGDPAIDDGEADRHQADRPVAVDGAQPGDSSPLQCAGDPGLVHRSIIAAPIGTTVRPGPNRRDPERQQSRLGCVRKLAVSLSCTRLDQRRNADRCGLQGVAFVVRASGLVLLADELRCRAGEAAGDRAMPLRAAPGLVGRPSWERDLRTRPRSCAKVRTRTCYLRWVRSSFRGFETPPRRERPAALGGRLGNGWGGTQGRSRAVSNAAWSTRGARRSIAGHLRVEELDGLGPGAARDVDGNVWVTAGTAMAYGIAGEDDRIDARDAAAAMDRSQSLRNALWLNGRTNRTVADFYMIHEYADETSVATKGSVQVSTSRPLSNGNSHSLRTTCLH